MSSTPIENTTADVRLGSALNPCRQIAPTQAGSDQLANRHLGGVADQFPRFAAPQDGIAAGQGAEGTQGVEGQGQASQVLAPEGELTRRGLAQTVVKGGQALPQDGQAGDRIQVQQARPGLIPASVQAIQAPPQGFAQAPLQIVRALLATLQFRQGVLPVQSVRGSLAAVAQALQIAALGLAQALFQGD